MCTCDTWINMHGFFCTFSFDGTVHFWYTARLADLVLLQPQPSDFHLYLCYFLFVCLFSFSGACIPVWVWIGRVTGRGRGGDRDRRVSAAEWGGICCLGGHSRGKNFLKVLRKWSLHKRWCIPCVLAGAFFFLCMFEGLLCVLVYLKVPLDYSCLSRMHGLLFR